MPDQTTGAIELQPTGDMAYPRAWPNWWVNGFPGVSAPNYSARGALGKYIVVVPERDLVVVYQNHTEFPDDAAAYPPEKLRRLPNVSAEQMGGLLKRILDAQPTSARTKG